MHPSRLARVDLKMAFFNPYRDELNFYNGEKKKILRSVFVVFYMEELRHRLKEAVVMDCPNCNQDVAGHDLPKNHPHTCDKFKTMREAFDKYGTCATNAIAMHNKARWRISRKWWDWVFDLPPFSSIKEKDAISFVEETEHDLFEAVSKNWKEEFDDILERFSWNGTSACEKMLCQLSYW